MVSIHRLLMLMGEEVADAPVDPIIVMQDVFNLVSGGTGAFLMAYRDDQVVGVMGLERARYRYSREYCIREVYFFVRPDERDGDVAPALLKEATAIADQAEMKLYVTIANPKRRRGRPGKVLSMLRYEPMGSTYQLSRM